MEHSVSIQVTVVYSPAPREVREIALTLEVGATVQQALLGQGGPYAPYLALVSAVEQDAAYDMREAADQLMLGMAEVNQALLRALLAGRQLDG